MTPGHPKLITVAHGTRQRDNNLIARSITSQAARRLGGLPHATSYVELCKPLFAKVMDEHAEPAIVVPLLLSTGYHLRHDLPEALNGQSVLAGPLGPHPLLAEVMCHRLSGSGARRGSSVVMVAAGSQDPAVDADLELARALLQARWGAPVRLATITARGRRLPEVLADARGDGEVAVAPYLLAPGRFAELAATEARRLGVEKVAAVIGDHPLVAELVARRYRAIASRTGVAAGAA
jgi:sirohydrochlorin ferrochelatase